MYGRVLALGLGLLVVSSSYAADVDVLFNVQEGPGPYTPDATLTVDVLLSRVAVGDPLPVRLVQFDTSASDPALGLSLPATHSENTPTFGDDIHFWYFGSLSAFGGICATDDAADCGQKHFLEADLAGNRPNVISMAYLGLMEQPLEELTIPGDPAQSVKVGVMSVTVPSAPGTYTLDLMNATEGNADVGGAEIHVSHVLPLTPLRAFDGGLGGGTLDLDVGAACAQAANMDFAALNATEYHCDAILSRNGKNVLRFAFDIPVTAPAPGEIEINEIQGPGVFGPDISASFSISIENGNVLKITEPNNVFANNTWYAIRNVGGWCEAGDFEVDYGVAWGDADGFGGAGFNDLNAIFNVIQTGLPGNSLPDSSRFDIDGFGGIGFNDLNAAFAVLGSSAGPNPSTTGCSPTP